jgi:hypothetical protein
MSLFKKRQDLPALLRTMKDAEFGPERLAMAERGIAQALLQNDDEAGFAFREDLLISCVLMGELHRAVPAMEWCLSRCDQEPAKFDLKQVLFQYKWIIEELPRHSSYTADSIEQGLLDLERRFAAAGWSRRGPLELRMLVAWTMRRMDEANRCFGEWDPLPPDDGSDCPACAAAHRVRFHIYAEDPVAAAQAAKPLILEEHSCLEEPVRCFSRLQFIYAENDQVEQALELHARSIEHCLIGPQFADVRCNHMVFLMCGGQFEQAGRLLEISLPQAIEGHSDLALLDTCAVGALVMRVLIERRLEMPSLEPAPKLGVRDSSEWLAWMTAQAHRLAPLFDRRNGNTVQAELLAEYDAWAEQLVAADD